LTGDTDAPLFGVCLTGWLLTTLLIGEGLRGEDFTDATFFTLAFALILGGLGIFEWRDTLPSDVTLL
jgi:hypothetical protein